MWRPLHPNLEQFLEPPGPRAPMGPAKASVVMACCTMFSIPSATSLTAVLPQGHPRKPSHHTCLRVCFLGAHPREATQPSLKSSGERSVGSSPHPSVFSVCTRTPVQQSQQKLEETWEHGSW